MLALILVMTVALAIGLSVIQKSLVDVSTSTKVEQSSMAFSAAEAGIERSLQTGGDIPFTVQENDSQYQALNTGLIPVIATSGNRQDPLECPPGNPFPLAKEDIAHVWLAEYTSTFNPPPAAYKQNTLEVYWGNSQTDKAALELTLVYYGADSTDPVDTSAKYRSRKWYLDHTVTRSFDNKFTQVACAGYSSGLSNYQCTYTIGGSADPGGALPTLPSVLMLLRARLLYNDNSQPLAVRAVGTCGLDCSIPSQTRLITSVGTSGPTQRKIQVCQTQKVVPPYFDYAIFSVGEIKK